MSATLTRLVHFTYLGGPTLLIEIGNIRFLTDPTFDPAGSMYEEGDIRLEKLLDPAKDPESLPSIDAVLLTHDQHVDNLDSAGRSFLRLARNVITTSSGSKRLGGNAVGLAPWDSRIVWSADGAEWIVVNAMPARHGPPGSEDVQGEVIGFCLEWEGNNGAIYLSGDTVWFEGLAEVARRFKIETAVLFLGAAVIPAKGLEHLTMTSNEAIITSRELNPRRVVPVHFEGWAHLSQGKNEVSQAFESASLFQLLVWLEPGRRTLLSI